MLTATTYLVLLMALFLSVFSLPTDIKNNTIYTIVTKPVRPGEIVLGRILGFSLIGTVLLAVMGVFSYVFVVRVLNHTHDVEVASLEPVPNDPATTARAARRSSKAIATRSRSTPTARAAPTSSRATGTKSTEAVDGDETTYVVGPPQRHVHGPRAGLRRNLQFKDRSGAAVSQGHQRRQRVEVSQLHRRGHAGRGHLGLSTTSRPRTFPDGLPIEMTIRVFRSHKGDIEKGISGSLVLRNPRNRASKASRSCFEAKDG